MKQQYRIVRGRYLRRVNGVGKMLRPGDKFTPSSSMEVKKLGDQIEPVRAVVRTKLPTPSEDKGAEGETSLAAASAENQDAASPGKGETPVTISEELGGGWFVLSTGEKVHGKEKALERVQELNDG